MFLQNQASVIMLMFGISRKVNFKIEFKNDNCNWKKYVCLEMSWTEHSELVRYKQIMLSAINNSIDFFTFSMSITFHNKNNILMKHDATETIKTLSILQKAFDIRFKCGLAKNKLLRIF